MDIGTTVSAIRREYKDFLRAQNPSWTESLLKSHVANAFYIWNYTLMPSFWKCLVDEDSIASAKDAIYDYLKNEIMADNAEAKTDIYISALKSLKNFLDTTYGGVEKRVGYELDCEKILYNYAKQAYEGTITPEQAVSALSEQVPCYNSTSHKLTIFVFASMMKGEKYTRRANLETTLNYITEIGKDYGSEFLKNALFATQESIKYYYEQTGTKSNSLCRECNKIAKANNIDIDFTDSIFEGIIPKQTSADELVSEQTKRRYWIYTPGEYWEEMYTSGIITIGRDYIGDPSIYNTKQEMQNAMQDYGTEPYTSTYKNASLEVWQFVNEMKPGDIIIAKEGTKTVLGRGVIESDFNYDESKPTEFKYYRKIKWTHKGTWEHPGTAITKRLTDITPYTDYLKKLNALFEDEIELEQQETSLYSKEDFLNEVFINESDYTTLVNLLKIKKNIILQGAPGVGKTFIADRLAYSLMGEVDKSRVEMVQFHQSYSYEDFIMGYRPTESNGFTLHEGEFYNFCKKAAEDGRDHFFIIDEINRGNLSKIFGELFMLIEADKRGKPLNLMYRNEQFSIPENLYIIGMMNTADRSLAMMDYALRRRFAFFELNPAFDNATFKKYLDKVNNDTFKKLIESIQHLNTKIETDDSLGKGFRIGHSYFYKKDTNLITDEWMCSVVRYEILPLLEEYWFDEREKINEWREILEGVVSKK